MAGAVLAVGLNGAGLAAIYCAWCGWFAPKRRLLALGWSLVLIAAVFWCRHAGVEFGIVYAVLATTLAAWVAVVVNHELRARKGARQGAGQTAVPDPATVARNVARFFVAVPLAALASTFLGVLLVSWLPLGRIDAMAVAVLGIPVLWGIASYWVCADSRLVRPTLGLALAGALSAAVLYTG